MKTENGFGGVLFLLVVLIVVFASLFTNKLDQRNIDMIIVFAGLGCLALSCVVGIGLIAWLIPQFQRQQRRRRRRRELANPEYEVLPGMPVKQIEMQKDNLGTWQPARQITTASVDDWG